MELSMSAEQAAYEEYAKYRKKRKPIGTPISSP
jgi:hypothetical protein